MLASCAEQRVLIAAPSGCDAEILGRILRDAGITPVACTTPEDLCRKMEAEAAVAILAEEFLTPAAQQQLSETLVRQPEWSDFPLIVMAAADETPRQLPGLLRDLNGSAYVVRLQRPVRKFTLMSSVRAALQSRARQYQIRDELQQRRQAEVALRQSKERYRQLVGLMPVGVYTCQAPGGVITFYNEQAAGLWGRAPRRGDTDERFCGSFRLWRPDGTLLPHSETPMAVALREGCEFRNESVIIERPDGSRINGLVNIDPIRDAEGRVVGAINIFHDITELIQTQDALRQSEERFRELANHIDQFAWTCDELGSVTWYNQRWYDYTGTTLEDMRGWGWQKVHHPDHVERVVERIRRSFATGEAWEDVFPLRSKEGEYRWFLSRALPIRDEKENIVRWFGTNTDITEQRQAEAALREADRRKDEFLAMLAHELRNPLAPIRAGLELLKMVQHEPETIEEIRCTMERQTNQLVTLVDDLLDVSRITRGKLELRKCRVTLADVIQSAVEASSSLIDDGSHHLNVSLPEQPILMEADPNRLAQVFSNLLNNAAKYTPTMEGTSA